MRAFYSLSGTWRLGSLKYGMKYGMNKLQVLSSFFKEKDYWLKTPYGVFHCPDIASAWQFSRGWELQVKQIVVGLRYSFFVDIGANIGFYSMLAANNGNRVLALEPNEKAFKCLVDTAEANENGSRICHRNVAAWSKTEKLKLNVGRHTDVSQIAAEGQDVWAIRLDEVLFDRPGLMKIDAEGSEPEILKGLIGVLNWRFPIIFESLNDNHLDKCIRILWPFDYRIRQLDRTNFFAECS